MQRRALAPTVQMMSPAPQRPRPRGAPLACPHCTTALPPSAPGVFFCGRCGKTYAVPTPAERARLDKKRADEKHALLLVGGAMFAIYVLPVVMMLGYFVFWIGFYLVLFLGSGVASAVR